VNKRPWVYVWEKSKRGMEKSKHGTTAGHIWACTYCPAKKMTRESRYLKSPDQTGSDDGDELEITKSDL
jgi:hypothetical protein